MKSAFLLAITQLSAEKNLSSEVLLSAIEEVLVSAYRKDNFAPNQEISVKINPSSGKVQVWAGKTIVEKPVNTAIEITLADARKVKPEAELGEIVMIESTPANAGRIAAQTAKQVILQRLHEAEHTAIFEEYADREGEIVTGLVQRVESRQILVDLGRTEAVLPAAEQVPGERYRVGQRVKVCILEVVRTNKGPRVILSRSHPDLLRRLFGMEIPEIYNGTVVIESIAREAGFRSKIAVSAKQEGIDPVGCCVGLRGIRIQNIVNELNGEKIDVVMWDKEPAAFITNALSPAQITRVTLNQAEGVASVTVPDRQLSLAIGKEGQNVRLATKLTGWRIDAKSASAVETEEAKRSEDLAEVGITEEVKVREVAEQAEESVTVFEDVKRTKEEIFAMVNKNLEQIKLLVSNTRKILNEKRPGANLNEAHQLLKKVAEAIKKDQKDQYDAALNLAKEAELAASPTTEYLLSRSKEFERQGDEAYQKQDFPRAVELWKTAIQEYARVRELANLRGEQEIIERVDTITRTIEDDIHAAGTSQSSKKILDLVAQANKAAAEGKSLYEADKFDQAVERFQVAQKNYSSASEIAHKQRFEDEPRLVQAGKGIQNNIESVYLEKGKQMLNTAMQKTGDDKEKACSKVTEFLKTFSSSDTRYAELMKGSYRGIARSRIEVGIGITKEAEDLFKKSSYYQARESYRKAQDHFNKVTDFTVEQKLEDEQEEVDRQLKACVDNIGECAKVLTGTRTPVAGKLPPSPVGSIPPIELKGSSGPTTH